MTVRNLTLKRFNKLILHQILMSSFDNHTEIFICSPFERLRYLFETRGDSNYIGEQISIVDHSLQCAYFASKKSSDRELIIASLLHDIGHALGLEVEREMVSTFFCITIKQHDRTIVYRLQYSYFMLHPLN